MKNEHIPFRMSHILIKVTNLHTAVRDYEQLGFTVTWGSKPAKAHNALIYLKDSTFLELFTFNRALEKGLVLFLSMVGNSIARRFHSHDQAPEGSRDYALESDRSLNDTVRMVRKNGIAASTSRQFSRARPDGIKLRWFLSFPTWPLPFMMSDCNPKLPVPREAIQHENGVVAAQALTVGTTTWEQSLAQHQSFYGQRAEVRTENARRIATFTVKPSLVHLVESDTNGIQQITLRTLASPKGHLDNALTHGAKIYLVG